MENAILFVGATGVGKSFICNKIFEMCNSPIEFKSGSSLTAVTRVLQQGNINYEGKRYCIVDSPGFFDTQTDNTPEKTARTDGENMCKLVKALEECKNIYSVVFVFEGRFSLPHQMWYDRILDVVGKVNQGQVILMNNKQVLMSEVELIRNEVEMEHLLSVNQGGFHYFPIPTEPKGGQREEGAQVKEQLRRFLSTVTRFVPINLKDLKVPEVCYEKEVTGEPFEREISKSTKDEGTQVTNILDKSGYVEKMAWDGNPLRKALGFKTKIREFQEHKVEELVHVPKEVTTRVVGFFRCTYKIRFDGTRDFVKEECLDQKIEHY